MKILILYGVVKRPLTISLKSSLYCYEKYSNHQIYYYSLSRGSFPKYLKDVKFDVVIFHTWFLSSRWEGAVEFANYLEEIEFLKNHPALKVMLPQDEWYHTKILSNFINSFKVDFLFTVAPESEWPIIYQNIEHSGLKFIKTLTGYLDEDTVEEAKNKLRLLKKNKWIGYRAYKSPAWLGRFGYKKSEIAHVFLDKFKSLPQYKVDISTNPRDTIPGSKWLEFLIQSRFTLGVEGGSFVLDPEGEIMDRGNEFMSKNNTADFDEVERNVFPGLDGTVKLRALSPRHLEACATMTCQILVEGEYNGILKKDIHYISLKEDFSNVDEVIEKMNDEEYCDRIVENAHRDIIESERYTYRFFVEEFYSQVGVTDYSDYTSNEMEALERNRKEEWLMWKKKKNFDFVIYNFLNKYNFLNPALSLYRKLLKPFIKYR